MFSENHLRLKEDAFAVAPYGLQCSHCNQLLAIYWTNPQSLGKYESFTLENIET